MKLIYLNILLSCTVHTFETCIFCVFVFLIGFNIQLLLVQIYWFKVFTLQIITAKTINVFGFIYKVKF
jgi:hypothetical protein